MKMYQLHQIPAVVQCLESQAALTQIVSKLTHGSGTIIDDVYVSQTINAIQNRCHRLLLQ